MLPGQLFVVATPIGNMEDITLRAIQTLKTVDIIAAEDTRHASRLTQQFSIETQLTACHDHNEQGKVTWLIQKMLEGQNIALVSDAGTPLISDPGYRLVKAAQDAGITVHPIPGACAAIAALSAAGLPSDHFRFEGFLPAKTHARQQKLQALSQAPETLIFYEAPHRIVDSLQDMVAVFGPEREVTLARELTKTFETIKKMSVSKLLTFVENDKNQQKGEIVLLVAGANMDITIGLQHKQMLKDLLEYLPPKQAAQLMASWTGIKKSEFYDLALSYKKQT